MIGPNVTQEQSDERAQKIYDDIEAKAKEWSGLAKGLMSPSEDHGLITTLCDALRVTVFEARLPTRPDA